MLFYYSAASGVLQEKGAECLMVCTKIYYIEFIKNGVTAHIVKLLLMKSFAPEEWNEKRHFLCRKCNFQYNKFILREHQQMRLLSVRRERIKSIIDYTSYLIFSLKSKTGDILRLCSERVKIFTRLYKLCH